MATSLQHGRKFDLLLRVQAQVPDHYQFLPQHMAFWDKYDSIGLQGGAGSLFLWDSRTAHTVST